MDFFKFGFLPFFQVIAKLGWGHFSTVWLVQLIKNPDFSENLYQKIGSFYAMKVQKSASHYTDAAFDEIELLSDAAKHATDAAWSGGGGSLGKYNDLFGASRWKEYNINSNTTGLTVTKGSVTGEAAAAAVTVSSELITGDLKRDESGTGAGESEIGAVSTTAGTVTSSENLNNSTQEPGTTTTAKEEDSGTNANSKENTKDTNASTKESADDSSPTQYTPLHTGVVQLVDYFETKGPSGRHICMIFEPMGPNVLSVIKKYRFKGVPVDIVRKITQDTLIGLDYLHRVCGIIHTDLKPENVLVECPLGIPVDKGGKPLISAEMIEGVCGPGSCSSVKGVSGPGSGTTNSLNNPDSTNTNAQVVGKSLLSKAPLGPPPYVKNQLKPSRSDPSLLSSYPEAEHILLRPPYHHHYQAVFPQRDNNLQSAAERVKNAKAEKGSIPQPGSRASFQTPNPEEIRAKCQKVQSLDLFSHKNVTYKIVDLGNACWVHTHFSDDIQTRQYRSPEVIIGSGYDTSSDVWSLACMAFELMTGDYLFDPKPSEEYPRDEDHLALTVELLGKMPSNMIAKGRNGKTFFNRHGDLRHIKTLRIWGLSDVLISKYQIPYLEAKNLASFLIPMLSLEPSKRVTAEVHLNHPWLRGLPSPELNAHFLPNAPQPGLTESEIELAQAKIAHQKLLALGGAGVAETQRGMNVEARVGH